MNLGLESRVVFVTGASSGTAAAVPVAMDLSDSETLDDAIATVHDQLGPIHVLVNNAIRWPPQAIEPFEHMAPQRFIDTVTANLIGPYLLARHAVADMRSLGWGRIVHVSTGLVEDGFPGNVDYGAAKSGLHGMTRFMSRELASAGILTNVVMAGFTPDDKPIPDTMRQLAAAATATKRVTEPDDIARMIVFLCSAANTNTTGELIRVDGHFLAPLPG